MKKGILTGLLIVVVIVGLLVVIFGLIYLQFNQRPNIPSSGWLSIQLRGTVTDMDNSLFSPPRHTIKDLYFHLARARIDPRIQGILTKVSMLDTTLDKAEEIGRLLKEFRDESGKRVIAFVEEGGLRELLVGSYADRVYALKNHFISLPGMSMQAIFLKEALSNLGIQPDFLQIGEYKTAPNMFTRDGFTRAHRESYEVLMEDLFTSTLQSISRNRDIDPADLRAFIDRFPISNREFLDNGLIDGFLYEDEILEREEIQLPLIPFSDYRRTRKPNPFQGTNTIAVIFAMGEIHTGGSGGTSLTGTPVMGSDTIARLLKKCRENPAIKGVVLRVNSPGGSPTASDIIRREAELTMQKKPLVVSMSSVAASGGYYISMSSSRILALPQTITGSIGVYGGKFVLRNLYDKIGVTKKILKTSPYAGMFSDYHMFTERERDKYAAIMNHIYDSFVSMAGQFRHIEPDHMENIARGRVWSGLRALDHRLIDGFGGLNRAVQTIRELADIPPDRPVSLVSYPRKMSLFEFIMQNLSARQNVPASPLRLKNIMERYRNFFPAYILPVRILVR